MILRIEDIKEVCSKLLMAVDSNNLSQITETLELEIIDKQLYMSVTNREYIVTIKIPTFRDEQFHATVNAIVFLKLMNQITTESVTLEVQDRSLKVIGNGTYNLPMIYENDNLMTLPKIEIENETNSFDISTKNLMTIYNYNSKELNKDGITNPVQKMYYVDRKGCITFTTGACVTNFDLGGDVTMLLSPKVVKLFKLFTDDTVSFKLGQDSNDGVSQTKVSFSTDSVNINAILMSDENMVNSVPKDAIRNMATNTYDNSIVVNRQVLLNSVNRLLLFVGTSTITRPYCKFKFDGSNTMTIYDKDEINNEKISIENNVTPNYEMIIDLTDIKLVLEASRDEFITMNFGNQQSMVIQRPGVYNVIPECVI